MGSGWRIRVNVNKELNFLGKFPKKFEGGQVGGRVGGGGCERNVGGRG